jgi:hypothetical protein
MASRRLDENLYYSVPGTQHYNVMCVGRYLFTRVTARSFGGFSPEMIEWAWLVEGKRYATPAEITCLCRRR